MPKKDNGPSVSLKPSMGLLLSVAVPLLAGVVTATGFFYTFASDARADAEKKYETREMHVQDMDALRELSDQRHKSLIHTQELRFDAVDDRLERIQKSLDGR